jgi:hypothetical protein
MKSTSMLKELAPDIGTDVNFLGSVLHVNLISTKKKDKEIYEEYLWRVCF